MLDTTYVNPPELLSVARDGLPSKSHAPAHVIVLGAGIAGLVAACELKRAGHRVTVLEAQHRVGGRVLTLRAPFSAGQWGEAGAMRIPVKHKLVMAYVERYGLRVRPFCSSNPMGWSLFRKHRRRLGDTLRESHRLGFDLAGRELTQPFPEIWSMIVDPISEALDRSGPEALAELRARLQSVSLRDFLRGEGWSDGAIEMYGLFAGFETLLYASAFEFLREFVAKLREQTVAIDGGMDLLPQAFLPELAGDIQYGALVASLDQDERGVAVRVRGLGGARVVHGDYAICTLPFSVLRHVEVDRPFSWQKQRAIRNIHYESATKIFFECRERFWETRDGIYGGASVTDLAIRNTYYPEHGRASGRGVLLASYSHGQDALRWGALPPHERHLQALENLGELHPEAPSHVEAAASTVWSHDEFAGGAYAFFQPHQEAQLHDHVIAPEGRYHFAGEHASLQHRWLQGGVESALRAAREVHARTLREPVTLRSENPMRSPAFIESEEARVAVARDFGGVVRDVPAHLVRPRSIEEVAEAVRWARARGLKVAARGVGHSAGGQSQARDGLVLDMTGLDQVHHVDLGAGRFVADAGVTWQRILDVLLPLGLVPDVVTDWLHLTLGGTIIAGGVGAQSFKRGIQADLIEEMTVVTGEGEVVTCSATQHADLFDATRAGLGQYGIIVRATMRLGRAPRRVTLDHLVYDDLDAFAGDVERLMECPSVDGLLAHAVGNTLELIAHSTGVDARTRGLGESPAQGRWVYDLEVLRYHDETTDAPGPLPDGLRAIAALSHAQPWDYNAFLSRVPPIVERDQREGAAPHPELALFIPHTRLARFLGEVMAETAIDDMGGGPILIIPLARGRITAPFFRIPDEPRCWLVGFLRAAKTPERVAALTRVNVDLYHRAVAVGGRRYPCDGVPAPVDGAGWAQHFGDAWTRALAAKKRFDPDRLLAPALGIFRDAP
jgi:monoamine oxidase